MRVESSVARWLRRRPLASDGLVAAGVAAVLVPLGWAARTEVVEFGFRPPGVASTSLVLASCLVLAARRLAPVPVLLATVTLLLVEGWGGWVQLSAVPVLAALYTVTAYCGRRHGLAALATTLAAFGAGLVLAPVPVSAADVLSNAGVAVAAWALGRSVRVRRAYVVELELRAASLQATRDADARAVLAEERGRIARELHDVVAHHVSVMTVQAAAAQRMIDRDPGRSREAMAAVESTGRAALGEMRRIVGVLRHDGDLDGGDLSPQPGLADLRRLVEQLRDVGLDVDVVESGSSRPVDAGIDLTAFRVVQEALTNTLKHGGTSRALVCIDWRPRELEVRVIDEGIGAAAALPAPEAGGRPGHGLTGMRERIALYGGRLRAGPRHGGGYEVRANIPLEQVPA